MTEIHAAWVIKTLKRYIDFAVCRGVSIAMAFSTLSHMGFVITRRAPGFVITRRSPGSVIIGLALAGLGRALLGLPGGRLFLLRCGSWIGHGGLVLLFE